MNASLNSNDNRNLFIRLPELYEVLRKSRISIFSVIVIVGAFLIVPQAQDALRSMAQPGVIWHITAFEIILVFWAVIVWYGARFLLDHDFIAIHHKKTIGDKRLSLWGEEFVPRFLGAFGLSGMGIAIMITVLPVINIKHMHYKWILILGIFNIVSGVAFYFALQYRRRMLISLSSFLTQRIDNEKMKQALSYNQHETRVVNFAAFPVWLRWTLIIGPCVSVFFWIVIVFKLQIVAPWLGAPTVVILSGVFLTIFSNVLAWYSERYNMPFFIFVIILLGIFGGLFSDNHEVRKKTYKVKLSDDMTAESLYNGWLKKMDEKYGQKNPHPMFIVAASGGGIKAAYWTASVLSDLQDKNPTFAEHTIIISPVSGGALGSLAFENLVINKKDSKISYLDLSKAILSNDFLSPALGSLLFHDFPASFFPFRKHVPDRAKALEKAWERAWEPEHNKELKFLCSSDLWLKNVNPFKEGFATLRDYERQHELPTLIINGTSVETGQRILTTHLNCRGNFKDCQNLFEIRDNDINMSTAAMMSSRFTYVSPAGTIDSRTHVVDGGYYENSGATTALQFYESIRDKISRDNVRSTRVIPIFIQIDNDYVAADKLDRNNDKEETIRARRIFPELTTPVWTLLNTRNAHAVSAQDRVKKTFDPERYYHYSFEVLRDLRDIKAPLGWFLSKAARVGLDKQLTSNQINHDNTARISSILADFNKQNRNPFIAKDKEKVLSDIKGTATLTKK